MIGNSRQAEDSPIWGCVLIGGKSRRMGQPKHLLEQSGITWIERTVALLRPRVEQVVVAGSGHLPAVLEQMVLRVDDVAGIGGPLAGILAAFRCYPEKSWLVAACDLPDLEDAALRWLLDCRGSEVLAVLPDLEADGRVEPLLAYYDRRSRLLLETMAASGQQRMQWLRQAQGVVTPRPPLSLRRCWRNVNTPEDLGLALPGAMQAEVTERTMAGNT